MPPSVVHGNGCKVRAELLKQGWDTALFGAPMGDLSPMAYWAPPRYPEGPLPDPAFDVSEQLPASPLIVQVRQSVLELFRRPIDA